jgi:hypothetical protein
MVVDFQLKKVPELRVALVAWEGPYQESRIRREFESIARWLKERHVRSGRWVFSEAGERSFKVAIEVFRPIRGEGRIHVRTLSAGRVASIEFDPDLVSPRVIYHGLMDWLRWRRREHAIRSVGSYREVYSSNPWRDARAWAHTEVQVVVK